MQVSIQDMNVSIPMPIFVVVEDVGWWQGADGSACNEPYRNSFPRRHCLDDYRALVWLGKRLKMRVALGMVLGEWDRTNLLQSVPGSTWMGDVWDNRHNQGPWLDEASAYLRANQDFVEIACHGLCHEFWQGGQMERSEFHDSNGEMRPTAIVKKHLEAYNELLAQNNLSSYPRLFLPPALHHSFGNGEHSFQAILGEFGIRYVVTCFSRARRYAQPHHEKITWECGIGILERGLSPVSWRETAALPSWGFNNPVLPLHWSNLLHTDPHKNNQIVDHWADMLLTRADDISYILAEDIASCWNQAAVFYLAGFSGDNRTISFDLGGLQHVPAWNGTMLIKIENPANRIYHCHGGQIVSLRRTSTDVDTVCIRLLPGQKYVELTVTA